MSQEMKDLKPLYLSVEEALGLLDLCMMSDAEFDQDTVGVLLKLSDLVREHLAARVAEAGEAGRPGSDDPRTETNGDVSGAFRQSSHRPVLKPCPAGRFRSWTVMPTL
jgi:hypothetical protein